MEAANFVAKDNSMIQMMIFVMIAYQFAIEKDFWWEVFIAKYLLHLLTCYHWSYLFDFYFRK
jgi:hypothetical protein